MAVVTLYQTCAPKNERGKVVRALIRFLRESREIQYCLLNYIYSITLTGKACDIFLCYIYVIHAI